MEEEIQNVGGDARGDPNKKIEELEDQYKRLMAEFDNFKKRNSKERDFLYSTLITDVIGSFLPIIDNLEKATATKTEDEAYKQGVEMVLKQFLDVLKFHRVETIESVGKVFNPELHEAVSHIEDSNYGEKIITEEYRKGYKIGDKVLRHAMVIVAN